MASLPLEMIDELKFFDRIVDFLNLPLKNYTDNFKTIYTESESEDAHDEIYMPIMKAGWDYITNKLAERIADAYNAVAEPFGLPNDSADRTDWSQDAAYNLITFETTGEAFPICPDLDKTIQMKIGQEIAKALNLDFFNE